ncbi:aminotransferase class I/II-fold pyridoxal phosphate-dependent enzyme [Streptomyces sp. NPDC050788]|uniref:pyridoxal phosphate-dependent aminotransferase n=1 Tax=Streptomyces sp. NPDC050788 TaxID=3155041 RepID=UPI00344982AC
MCERACEIEAQGSRVIHLEAARPDLDAPQVVKDAALEALDAGRVHHSPNAGTATLRQEIALMLSSSNDLRYDPSTEVIVTNGANEAVLHAIMTFCNPGDEVILPVPAWPAYDTCIRLAQATPVYLPLSPADDYVLDPYEAQQLLTPRTRMIVVCTPHHPTGAVIDHRKLDQLAEALRHTRVLVLADESYSLLVYVDRRHVPVATAAGLKPRTITVGSFAKSYGMGGWCAGWLAGPKSLLEPMLRVRRLTAEAPPTFLQDAAVIAIHDTAMEQEDIRQEFSARRAAALTLIGEQDLLRCVPPAGTFYLYLTYPKTHGAGRGVHDEAPRGGTRTADPGKRPRSDRRRRPLHPRVVRESTRQCPRRHPAPDLLHTAAKRSGTPWMT